MTRDLIKPWRSDEGTMLDRLPSCGCVNVCMMPRQCLRKTRRRLQEIADAKEKNS